MVKEILLISTASLILLLIFFNIQDYYKIKIEDVSPTHEKCYEQECNTNLCTPEYGIIFQNLNINCQLNPLTCKCAIDNYDSFYIGLGNNEASYNPTANLYKSYNNLLNFVGINQDNPKLEAYFIQNKMQYYSEGKIFVWPNDKYGQYHESIHFLLRHYTIPQDGFYPYLEEGMAHYGAYCLNNPNSARCDFKFGTYVEEDICVPDVENCKGQIKDTSLVLQLRQDYGCDWNHCWKEFINWAITEKKDKHLTLQDSIEELNKITKKDIRPLLLTYGVDEYKFPTFAIVTKDEVIEESIINENGEFTTL